MPTPTLAPPLTNASLNAQWPPLTAISSADSSSPQLQSAPCAIAVSATSSLPLWQAHI